MTSRRGSGEGSIRYRDKEDRWVATFETGWSEGKRQRRSIYGHTRSEVATKLREAQHRKETGHPVTDARQRTGPYLEHWLTNIIAPTVRPATADNYAWAIRVHLIPALGAIPLARLAPGDIERLLAEKRTAGLSPNTVRLIRSALRRALGAAERRGLVVRNVAAIVDGPRVPRPVRRAMTVDDARRLLDACAEHRLGALVALLVETGLRRGEALGLRWEDLADEGRSLAIARTLTRRGGALVCDEPKTSQARRVVWLSAPLAARMRAHRRRQSEERLAIGECWHDTGHVFTTELGTPIDPRNLGRTLDALGRQAGLGHWTVHELRHTAASMMLARGIPLHVVSEVLGHAGIGITKDVYGHLVADERERVADAMGAALYAEAP
jgi:integrase